LEKKVIGEPIHPRQVWVPPRTTHNQTLCNIRRTDTHAFGGIKHADKDNDNDHRAEIVTTQLEQYATALRVLSRYPEAMNDFRLAIGGGAIQ
jgi:hypothetical protein